MLGRPDYRLAPENAYPCAIQDALDVYCSLTRLFDSNFYTAVNFRPRRLIVSGDSFGCHLSLAISHVLHHLAFPVPRHIVMIYPMIHPSIATLRSHSGVLTMIDPFISMPGAFDTAECYCPGKFESGANNNDQRSGKCTARKQANEMYYRDPAYTQRMREINAKASEDKFYNPLLGDFSCFVGTNLALMPVEFDPLLDEAIAVGRAWPEQHRVTFNVLRDVAHCFVADMLSKKARNALRATFRTITDFVRKCD